MPEGRGTWMSSSKFDVCLKADIPLRSYMSFHQRFLTSFFSVVMKNFTIGPMSFHNPFFRSVGIYEFVYLRVEVFLW